MKPYRWLSKRVIIGVVVCVLLVSAAYVGAGASPILAENGPPPDTEWEQTFGGTDLDFADSVHQTTDGGYIIAGTTNSYGAGGADMYLVKTDELGNVETGWPKTIGGSASDYGRSVEQTADGGYIIAGTTNSAPTDGVDMYLVKTDADGNITWDKTFGGSGSEEAWSVMQTADGGYIIAGSTDSAPADGVDMYLVKTDADGNITWDKTFGGSGSEVANSVEQTTDGGYIIAGRTSSYGAGGSDMYLVKTDASGNTEWWNTFGGTYSDEAFSVQQTADGGYIIAGVSNWCAYLVKTYPNGDLEWEKTFYEGSWSDSFSVVQTEDGGYILAGDTGAYDEWYGDAFLIKTDELGNVEFEKIIGGSDFDCAKSVEQTADGGYIVAGYTSSSGAGGYDVYLVKVAPWTSINTPAGENVNVSLSSGDVTFSTVSESGTTSMTTLTENPVDPTPSDFYVIEGSFFEISTTATYSGLITVGIAYDEAQVGNEESLRLFHWNGSAWEDATTYVDTVANIVYGEVSSLSPFFIGEPVVPPVADAGGPYLGQVNCSIAMDGSNSYHPEYPERTIASYDWNFGDGTPNGSGESVSHVYDAVGVYDVTLTVTDDIGAQNSTTTMAVVYDPTIGSATGGGWFWSAPGNLKSDPQSEGKATFGFVVKYKQGAADGNLEFQYNVGDINLKDTEISWLTVSEVNAQFQGEGTINGEGLYTFRVLAMDGDKAGGQPDEFTIKIWEGTDTEGDPIYQAINTQLGGGNIIIHNN